MIMTDGFSTYIYFPSNGGLAGTLFKEVTVKPPGLDSRGPIDISSMRNIRLITKVPKKLTDVTDMSVNVQWDPAIYAPLATLFGATGVMRTNQKVWVYFPNLELWEFYGYVDKFDPQDQVEGENQREHEIAAGDQCQRGEDQCLGHIQAWQTASDRQLVEPCGECGREQGGEELRGEEEHRGWHRRLGAVVNEHRQRDDADAVPELIERVREQESAERPDSHRCEAPPHGRHRSPLVALRHTGRMSGAPELKPH